MPGAQSRGTERLTWRGRRRTRRVIIIKKKKGGHGHHGGAWKVAYADFVTAMMALFMVLWLLATSSPKARQDIAKYFREPGLLSGGHAVVMPGTGGPMAVPPIVTSAVPTGSKKPTHPDPFDDVLQKQAKALQSELDRAVKDDPSLAALRNQVVVNVTPEGLLIQLIDRERNRNLLFDVSSAELKPALVHLLQTISTVLAHNDQPIYVGGHTDARPFVGSSKSNWELSFERANNARRVLESSGLNGRVRRVVGYANSEPFNASDPYADENRRLSILAVRAPTHR